MSANFDMAMDWVLAHEGGFVNHPKDPGRATNLGITQATLAAYRGRSVTVADVRSLTPQEARAIYRLNYWDRANCDDLPVGLDYAVFDYGVNSGVSRAVRSLQSLLGVAVDGIAGVQTIAAARRLSNDELVDLIRRYCEGRMSFLRRLKHWGTFGRGWTSRVMGRHYGMQLDDYGVVDRASMLAKGRSLPGPKPLPDSAKAKAPESAVGIVASIVAAILAIFAAKRFS